MTDKVLDVIINITMAFILIGLMGGCIMGMLKLTAWVMPLAYMGVVAFLIFASVFAYATTREVKHDHN